MQVTLCFVFLVVAGNFRNANRQGTRIAIRSGGDACTALHRLPLARSSLLVRVFPLVFYSPLLRSPPIAFLEAGPGRNPPFADPRGHGQVSKAGLIGLASPQKATRRVISFAIPSLLLILSYDPDGRRALWCAGTCTSTSRTGLSNGRVGGIGRPTDKSDESETS